ncbi:VOC family protein [Gulosibacter sp. 10]|uniref:VOC family protein n=1 Tax=Gulosibacter sp. 10 TaxID=1255570 RepID=UPI00097F3EB7|nr:VOC family protein [Gulosibacter sp. 10]SJM65305.1 3-demethylubiquinone-9 3-methyltransferase [Gulosibacter sp. 10]
MQFITPNIWCDGDAEEAVDFYLGAFPEAVRTSISHYPSEGLPEFQRSMAGEVLTIGFQIADTEFIAINAGDEFRPNPAISFTVNVDPSARADARGHIERLWERLGEGGEVLMPLDAYPFSELYGWVQDRFGTSWQLLLSQPTGELQPVIIPTFMFGGPVVNRARAAMERWTGIFRDSRMGAVAEYPEQTGPASPGSVMHGRFVLGGGHFAAMDSGVEQGFTFTEGVSLQVNCRDQAEIDRYWHALSAVPDAEACGWCKDEFGVSWQIVPEDMDDLMTRPRAYETLMTMRRIEIARFS